MEPPVRWGFLGAAFIARKNWQSVLDAGNASLIAIASRDVKRAQDFIDECQAQVPHPVKPQALGSYEELLAREDIDAVYIPLPTALRKEWVIRAAQAGKHVLVEKPITENTADAHALSLLAQQKNLVLQVGHIERFNPALSALEAKLKNGKGIDNAALPEVSLRKVEAVPAAAAGPGSVPARRGACGGPSWSR